MLGIITKFLIVKGDANTSNSYNQPVQNGINTGSYDTSNNQCQKGLDGIPVMRQTNVVAVPQPVQKILVKETFAQPKGPGPIFYGPKNEKMATPDENACTAKMNQDKKSCFVNKVYSNLRETPVWQLSMAGNVVFLHYKGKLVKMAIREDIDYKIDVLPKQCKTFFNKVDFKIFQNKLGDVVKVEGDPRPTKKQPPVVCCKTTKVVQQQSTYVDGVSAGCSASCPA